MLMNYERTVADFGKCKRSAKIMYGMDLVGKCVGSDFNGPCKVQSTFLFPLYSYFYMIFRTRNIVLDWFMLNFLFRIQPDLCLVVTILAGLRTLNVYRSLMLWSKR